MSWGSNQCRTCINFDSENRRPYRHFFDLSKPTNFMWQGTEMVYTCKEGECYVLENGTIPYIKDCKKYVKRNLSFYMKEILKKET